MNFKGWFFADRQMAQKNKLCSEAISHVLFQKRGNFVRSVTMSMAAVERVKSLFLSPRIAHLRVSFTECEMGSPFRGEGRHSSPSLGPPLRTLHNPQDNH